MLKTWLCLFLIIHMLGDFYLQSDKLAKNKHEAFKYVLLHSLIYLLAAVIVPLFLVGYRELYISLLFALLHFSIDSLKYLYCQIIKKRKKLLDESYLFFFDQIIHLICLLAIVITRKYPLLPVVSVGDFALLTTPFGEFTVTSDDFSFYLYWLFLLLLVMKPANLIIKHLLAKYKPKRDQDNSIENAGAFIGSLERIIILIFLSIGQYGAVGLVLTAKSIARYDKISRDQQFAEYYLLGTLLSTLFALIIYLFLFA